MDNIRLSVYGCGETVEGVVTDSLRMEREEQPARWLRRPCVTRVLRPLSHLTRLNALPH